MLKKISLVSVCLLLSTPVAAEDSNFNISLDTGARVLWNQPTNYAIDFVAQSDIEADNSTMLFGGNLGVSYALPADSALSNSWFDHKPVIAVEFGYYNGSSDASYRAVGNNANTLLGVTGIVGTFWSNGTWYAENDYNLADLSLTLTGAANKTSGTWSFMPEIGITGRYFEQDYDLDGDFDATTRRNVFDGELDSKMLGAQFGLNIKSPDYSGWSFALKPSAKLMVANTDMSVMQDKDGNVTGLVDRRTANDSDTSVVYEGLLEFEVEKKIDNVSIGLNLYGTATSGMAYIDMPEFAGDAAKINHSGMSYTAGARIGVSVAF